MSVGIQTKKIVRNYVFRIYPNKEQEDRLVFWLKECNWLYNYFVEERKKVWETEQKSISFYDQQKEIPILRQNRKSLELIYSDVLYHVPKRVDLAFKQFFRKIKEKKNNPNLPDVGYPAIKEGNDLEYGSFVYRSGKSCKIHEKESKIELPWLGKIKIVLTRDLSKVKIKQVTVIRSRSKKWYVCMACEIPEPTKLPPNDKTITIRVELPNKIILIDDKSTEVVIDIPSFIEKEEERIKIMQRRFEQNMNKNDILRAEMARVNLAKIHDRVKWRRKDFHHQITRRIVNEYGNIFVQSPNILESIRFREDKKRILDAGLSMFLKFLQYKAEEAGRNLNITLYEIEKPKREKKQKKAKKSEENTEQIEQQT
jgi:putative transposase